MKKILSLLLMGGLLAGCAEQAAIEVKPGRWYQAEQVQQGARLFQANCAVCHGDQAQGQVADWRKPLADGSYPPPPLNGSAHAWHHPLPILLRTIDQGGIPLGGRMPGFAGRLQPEEQLAVIAYFQNYWSEETYQQWLARDGLGR